MTQDTDRTAQARANEILGDAPKYNLSEIAARANVTPAFAERFWRAMGFPQPKPEEKIFTDQDVLAVQREAQAINTQTIDPEASISLIRALSYMTDRLALWEQEALVERLQRALGIDETSARLIFIDRTNEYLPHFLAQLEYSYRRQIAALILRTDTEITTLQSQDIYVTDTPQIRALGFVDMVAYTSRSKEIAAHQIADIVQAFEYTCRDIISANGARVVKTIGDAVLYIADDVATGAATVTEMVETLGRDSRILPVRASLAWGPIVSRSGDVFGEVVNLASRLVDIAPAGTVVCDEHTATTLAASKFANLYEMQSLDPTELQGIGEVNPIILRRLPGR